MEMPMLDPVTFGAKGDGQTDDTAAWARTVDAALASGARILLGGRTYAVKEIVLRPGIGGVIGPGTIRGIERTDCGLLRTEPGLATAAHGLSGIALREITFEVAEARCAIELFGAVGCLIEQCRVICSRHLHKGIWLRDGCRHNTLRGNRVTAPAEDLRSLVCVTVETSGAPGIAGYFQGTGGQVVYDDVSTWGNLLDGNTIEGGTHGIALGISSRNRIVNNLISGSRHRNINICPACRYNIVSNNQLLEAGSSAVAMAYGTCGNIVTDNQIASRRTTPDVDRDAIHAYVASGGNRIAGNVIKGTFRYGVYMAVSAAGNQVCDNRIHLEPHPDVPDDWSAGVVLETDWLARPLPAGARYSRQNFGAAPDGYRWAYLDTTDNEIRGNLVERATCGVYLAQLGERLLCDNRVAGNRCLDVDLALCVYGQAADRLRHNHLEVRCREGRKPCVELPAWPVDVAYT